MFTVTEPSVYGLLENHKHSYDRIGRWLLAAAIILGWAIGYGTEIHQVAIALLFSFLAGGVVLNVLNGTQTEIEIIALSASSLAPSDDLM